MNGWLLDTGVVSELANPHGNPRVRGWGEAVREDRLFISVLTLGEYDRGLARLPPDSGLRQRLSAVISAIETRFAGRVLSVADSIVRAWGLTSGELMRAAQREPPVIGALLAATAREHGLYLVTHNARDAAGSGAAVFNPWDDDPALFPLKSRRM